MSDLRSHDTPDGLDTDEWVPEFEATDSRLPTADTAEETAFARTG